MSFGLIDPDRIGSLEHVTEGVAMVHAFANVGIVRAQDGLLLVDVSSGMTAPGALRALRGVWNDPVRSIVYTHGHVDHVSGAPMFLEEAEQRGDPRPQIWAQENVLRRFRRYRRTWSWNNEVNRRQFAFPKEANVFPQDFVEPDHYFEETAEIELGGGERAELHHAEAETNDATWVWLPAHKTALVGDLMIHSMPNTGNPNKPQRYTLGWAEALDAILAKRPEHLVPGHGAPVHGELAREMLAETARALRFLHDEVVARLNRGQWPDEIADAGLELPPDLAAKPYLQPIYGCAPFVIRDVLREYAGWWGGDPAQLLPAPRSLVARDLLELAGRDAMFGRAKSLLGAGEAKRALHLAGVLVQGAPEDVRARALFAEILDALAGEERSFIARNFYAALARSAREESGA